MAIAEDASCSAWSSAFLWLDTRSYP